MSPGWGPHERHTYLLEFYMSPQGAVDGKGKPMATERNDHNYPYALVRIDMDTIMTLQARLREEQVRTGNPDAQIGLMPEHFLGLFKKNIPTHVAAD